MAHRHLLETVDKSFRDITGVPNVPFGAKVVVMGGDFRQTLPVVVPRGARAQVVSACLKSSVLWRSVRTMRLTSRCNMRLRGRVGPAATTARDASAEIQRLRNFVARWLLELGDGRLDVDRRSRVSLRLPPSNCVSAAAPHAVLNWVFSGLASNYSDGQWMSERAVLVTTNKNVAELNGIMAAEFPGENMVCRSAYALETESAALAVPVWSTSILS